MAQQKLTEADLDAARLRDGTEPNVSPHMSGLRQEPGLHRVFTGNAFERHTPIGKCGRDGFWRQIWRFINAQTLWH